MPEFRTTHNLQLGLLLPVEEFVEDLLTIYRREGIQHDEKAIIELIPITHPFVLGTCIGTFQVWKEAYSLIFIQNNQKGNGHLEDVFEMMEYLCKRDNKDFIIAAVQNERFRQHCLNKRGFVVRDEEQKNIIKYFKK